MSMPIESTVDREDPIKYAKSEVVSSILIEKMRHHGQMMILTRIFGRALYSGIMIVFAISSAVSNLFQISPLRFVFVIPVLIFAMIWIVENLFAKYAILRIEGALVTSEMSKIGREYNPWTNAYVKTRGEIESFGGRASVFSALDFEPLLWLSASLLIVYLC